jgi:hypothetical protein
MSADPIDHALQALLGRPEGSPPLSAIRLRPITEAEAGDDRAPEVLRAQTLSFDTLAPIEGGLFCERLFGAIGATDETRDARARALAPPILRARDDEVIPPRERTERFARITLAAPCAHPLLARAGWRETLASAGLARWELGAVPVLPPDLRPIVPVIEGGRARFMVSDLNDLYRQVLAVNARLHRLAELRAPRSVVDVEASRLGEALAQLIDNPATAEPRVGPSGRPLVGLMGMLAQPSRPLWPALAELDGMVARGVVRELRAPLAKRTLLVLSYLRALSITIEIVLPAEGDPATVH